MYQQLMATGEALVVLCEHPLLMVLCLGNFFLEVWPFRRVGGPITMCIYDEALPCIGQCR
jgi:hypothetical protein